MKSTGWFFCVSVIQHRLKSYETGVSEMFKTYCTLKTRETMTPRFLLPKLRTEQRFKFPVYAEILTLALYAQVSFKSYFKISRITGLQLIFLHILP